MAANSPRRCRLSEMPPAQDAGGCLRGGAELIGNVLIIVFRRIVVLIERARQAVSICLL